MPSFDANRLSVAVAPRAYYPSCVVNLTIRFDSAQFVTAEKDAMTTREFVAAANAPKKLLQVIGTGPIGHQSEQDGNTYLLQILPNKCDLTLEGHRKAGKFDIVIPYRDLPVDPRMIAAIGVDVHLGTVDPLAFSNGMDGAPAAGQTRTSVLNTFDEAGNQRLDTLAFVGDADSIDVDHGAKDSTLHIEGRDLRGALLDSPLPPDQMAKINTNQQIHHLVADIISGHPLLCGVVVDTSALPSTLGGKVAADAVKAALAADPKHKHAGLVIACNRAEWPNGKILSPALAKDRSRARKGAKGDKAGATQSPGGDAQKTSFWDLIVQYCFLVGAIPSFYGRVLWIRPTQSIYDATGGKRNPNPRSPFAGQMDRVVAQGEPGEPLTLQIRRMVFGRNVEGFKMARKLRGKMPGTIRVVSHDPMAGERGLMKVQQEDYTAEEYAKENGFYVPPKKGQKKGGKASKKSASGKSDEKEVKVIVVKGGIKNHDQLKQIARSIFYEARRGDLTGSIQTKDLASFGGDATDPDLLRMRPGDPIELEMDVRELAKRSPLVAELCAHGQRSPAEEIAAILPRCNGNVALATAIVGSARGYVTHIQNKFYVNNVQFNFEATSGVKVSFDFENFVDARAATKSVADAEGGAEGGAENAVERVYT